jgi:hypothetical protein
LFEGERDGLFQLRVLALADEGGVEVDFDVGGDAVVFDVPLAFGVVEGEVRGGDAAAVDEGRKPKMPTRPPQVRLPTSGPMPSLRNIQGMASPPEPANSLMIMTLGPKTPFMGVVKSLPARVVK